jgi:excisionase family DNA binding protein
VSRTVAPQNDRTQPTPVRSAWTVEAVYRLGLTTTVDTAASILGISRTKAYALAKSGEFPVHLVRVGRRYLVPIPALLELLGGRQQAAG